MNCNKVFETIGICGGGKMGTSFLSFIAAFDFNIVFYIRNEEKIQQVRKRYERIIANKSNNSKARAVFTSKIEDLSNCDVVFEFVSEDIEIKKLLFNALTAQSKNSRQIVVTGSSTIVPSKLCKEEALKSCIGVHFIYPVQYVKNLEVIYNNETSKEVIKRICDFLVYTGKNPIVVNEEAGSFTIKVLLSLQNEAFKLLEEFDVAPAEIDRIIAKDNIVLPPFDLCDSVGLDIIYSSINSLYKGTDQYDQYRNFRGHLERMIANGYLGRKSWKGFFSKSGNDDVSVLKIDENLENHIRTRLKLVYINSCLYLLNYVWIDTIQLDDVMREMNQSSIEPISFLFEKGAKEVLHMLDEFSAKYGEQFKPPEILKYIVKYDMGRDEIDRQIRLFKMGGRWPDWHNKNIITAKESFAKA